MCDFSAEFIYYSISAHDFTASSCAVPSEYDAYTVEFWRSLQRPAECVNVYMLEKKPLQS